MCVCEYLPVYLCSCVCVCVCTVCVCVSAWYGRVCACVCVSVCERERVFVIWGHISQPIRLWPATTHCPWKHPSIPESRCRSLKNKKKDIPPPPHQHHYTTTTTHTHTR